MGRCRSDSNRERSGRLSPLHSLDYGIDVDYVAPPEPLARALRRRIDGRYPVDPFGMDPHFGDLVAPAIDFLVRVDIQGGEHVPATGAAALVANRGFGVFEPAAVAVAVRKVVKVGPTYRIKFRCRGEPGSGQISEERWEIMKDGTLRRRW